jgi:hypothetical protein
LLPRVSSWLKINPVSVFHIEKNYSARKSCVCHKLNNNAFFTKSKWLFFLGSSNPFLTVVVVAWIVWSAFFAVIPFSAKEWYLITTLFTAPNGKSSFLLKTKFYLFCKASPVILSHLLTKCDIICLGTQRGKKTVYPCTIELPPFLFYFFFKIHHQFN